MGEKITEEQVANLLAILRTDVSNDAKVHQINNVKSGIKQNNVPEPCILPLFEATRTSMTSQHAAIVNAGFSTLNHLLTRLSRQEPKYVVKEAGRTLPLVIEKMGDQKEKYRQLAAQCLTTFWKVAPMDVERIVKNTGLVGKNVRTKEASMSWLVQMHQENGMPFKSFVTTLMELLEDADGMVRDTARNSVITLFQNAPNAAKSDLKRQLKNFNVRPAIVSAIVAHLTPGGPAEAAEPEVVVASQRPQFANSVSSMSSVRPATPVIEAKVEQVDPAYVNTQRELDDTFREMHLHFEGKESEQNWLKREQSCTKIRKLNAGNAPGDFHDAFLANIKSLLDGILKAVNSLRTSLSKEGCSVVQEVARTAGPGLDPMVEILLQNLIKLCGGTKKISSQQGNVTVDIIISKVSYNIRIMQHIWLACQDKNVQPRTYATGWLKTLLKKESHHKSQLEHSGGLDLIEKCIKKGLADANPGVRENMRSTYWAFAQIWPAKAEAIMGTLDATQQRLLENAPDNPNSPKKPDAVARPGLGFSKSTSGPPKPSLRETMLAQKKAAMAASKNMPARPGSAMSSFSPMRNVSTSSTASTSSNAPSTKVRSDSTTVSHGGLSVAPMRPTKFRPAPRPELTARPATAGPYSVRRPGHAPSNSDSNPSPSTRATKTRTPSASHTSPQKRPIPRPNTSHSSHASQSSHASPVRSTINKVAPSPRNSPPKTRHVQSKAIGSSPSRADEDFTMVVPTIASLKEPRVPVLTPTIDSSDDEEISTPAKPLQVYEDPFSSTDDQTTPRPTITAPVLEELAVNEDASNLMRSGLDAREHIKAPPMSPERFKQSSRLLDSGITKIKAKSLDVHGFRKLQGMIRDNKAAWSDDKFDVLLLGLFEYLEAPLATLAPEKVQDVKAQILATIKLMYKKEREGFRPHTVKGLESLLVTRSCYDSRTHIVSGLELLADELVTLADPKQTTDTIAAQLQNEKMTLEGCRTLSMGLHVLTELLEAKKDFVPSASEINEMCKLAARCIDSSESGVRLDAVQLCVSLHARVGDDGFWSAMGGVKDDPKNLITYYIVKRQREITVGN
ncbi:protein-like protein STU1 [Tricladium varicosporioides]|nr:protein-like protein STU1 [Hymenoscyphus varicosporioides]